MARVYLVKTCNLNIDGKVEKLEANKHHEIPDELVDPATDTGKFILAHTDNPPEYEPRVGTPEYAVWKQKKEARRLLLEEIMAEEAAEKMRSPKRGRA